MELLPRTRKHRTHVHEWTGNHGPAQASNLQELTGWCPGHTPLPMRFLLMSHSCLMFFPFLPLSSLCRREEWTSPSAASGCLALLTLWASWSAVFLLFSLEKRVSLLFSSSICTEQIPSFLGFWWFAFYSEYFCVHSTVRIIFYHVPILFPSENVCPLTTKGQAVC